MRKIVIVSLLAVLLWSGSASAQGPYLGAGFAYNDPLGADIDYLRPGPGLHFVFGYDFGPGALEGNLFGSRHDDSDPGYGDGDFSGFTIYLKIFLSPSLADNQFYLLGGFGSYSISEYDPFLRADTELNGTGWDLGAGLEHFINTNVSLTAQVIYRFITYDEFAIEGEVFALRPEEDGDMLSMELGVKYHF